MTTDDKMIHEKLQLDINREAAKILASSLSKIYKYKCFTRKKTKADRAS